MADSFRMMYDNISYKHSYSRIPEDNLYDRHCHNGYELLYIVKGEGTYVVEGAEYQMKPNTLLIARPCEFHCISPDKNMEYERDVLIFNEHALYNSTVAELSMLTQPATKSGVIHFSDENKIAAISAIFKQMKNTEVMFEGRKNRKEKEETMLSSLLTQLLLILSLLLLSACTAPSTDADNGNSEGADTVTLVIEGEVLTEYTVDVSKINLSGGVMALINYLEGADALDYEMDGTFITSLGELTNGEGGKYIYLFTSVESDFDVSIYSKTAEYRGMTLTSARVGASDMTLVAGAVIYATLVSF